MPFLDRLSESLDGFSTRFQSTPVIKATMMGPRAVGKTSIMASIFSETKDEIAGTKLYFRVGKDSSAALTAKRINLMSIFSKRTSLSDSPNAGAIQATAEETIFKFEMGFVGLSKTVDIEITDFPGEYLDSQPKKVSDYILQSQVIMIAIDTPYLMEEGGKYNEEKNRVKAVTRFVTEHPDEFKDKLIMFVPLKSERYFHDGKIDSVKQAVVSTYSAIINFCKQCNTACVVTPIQTLGDVEFDTFIDNPMPGVSTLTKLSKYRFCGDDAKFKPVFCVQPMYYVLTYVSNYYEWMSGQPMTIWDRLKYSIYALLKKNDEFFYEIKKLSKNIIVGTLGYDIIQNNTILNIK